MQFEMTSKVPVLSYGCRQQRHLTIIQDLFLYSFFCSWMKGIADLT